MPKRSFHRHLCVVQSACRPGCTGAATRKPGHATYRLHGRGCDRLCARRVIDACPPRGRCCNVGHPAAVSQEAARLSRRFLNGGNVGPRLALGREQRRPRTLPSIQTPFSICPSRIQAGIHIPETVATPLAAQLDLLWATADVSAGWGQINVLSNDVNGLGNWQSGSSYGLDSTGTAGDYRGPIVQADVRATLPLCPTVSPPLAPAAQHQALALRQAYSRVHRASSPFPSPRVVGDLLLI